MAIIKIPPLLRFTTNQAEEITVDNANLSLVLNNLMQKYPALGEHLLNKKGEIVPYVNIYLNETSVGVLDIENIFLKDSDVISIVVAIAGG